MTSDNDVDRRIQDQLRAIEVPPGLEERVMAIARAQVARRATPARRQRKRLLSLALAGLLLTGAGSAVAVWTLRSGDGSTVPVEPGAAAAIAESEVLARAPWLHPAADGTPHRIQETAPARSLAFPAGTTYAKALDRLLHSVTEQGRLPAGTTLGPPLADGVVWRQRSPGARPALDLRAPWGYAVPQGTIHPPAFTVSGRLSPAQASALLRAAAAGRTSTQPLPEGVRAGVPRLLACQVQRVGGRSQPCHLTALPATPG